MKKRKMDARKKKPVKAAPKVRKVKPVKKANRSKKAVTKKKVAPTKTASKPVGRVTHFYNEIGVAIVKFNKKVSTGATLYFKGATTDFKEAVKSMQYDHKPIATASKGKLIGIKVKKRVREGDEVYIVNG